MKPSPDERQPAAQATSVLRVAALQMVSTPRVDENLRTAAALISEAVAQGAELVALPEYFAIMGMTDADKVRLREADGHGPIQDFLAASAREARHLADRRLAAAVAGSPDKVLNSCAGLRSAGAACRALRQDPPLRLPAGQRALRRERDHRGRPPAGRLRHALRPRRSVDLLRPALSGALSRPRCHRPARRAGGLHRDDRPAHWEILLRARAIENQCYVLAVAQGGRHENGRETHGNSMLDRPLGDDPRSQAEGTRASSSATSITPHRLDEVRASLPALANTVSCRCRRQKPQQTGKTNDRQGPALLDDAGSQDPAHALRPRRRRSDKVFGKIMAHQVDYADLYFQYSRSEAWSLEEGIVKSGSFSIDEGVGVRAWPARRPLSPIPTTSAARRSATPPPPCARLPRGGQERRVPAPKRARAPLYVPNDPLASLDAAARSSCSNGWKRYARAADPRVTQVMAQPRRRVRGRAGRRQRRPPGRRRRPLVRVSLTVIVEQGGSANRVRPAAAGAPTTASSPTTCCGYAREAVHQAVTNLGGTTGAGRHDDRRPRSGWPGILLHEAVGHGLEGDFNRKGSSTFAGRIGSASPPRA
jgi:predicted amidohydrolase